MGQAMCVPVSRLPRFSTGMCPIWLCVGTVCLSLAFTVRSWFCPRNAPRFFSPWEVARGFLFPQRVRLPHQVGQAWEILGNSVSPLQCLAGLLTLDIARGRITRRKADDVIQNLVGSTVTLLDQRVESDDGWDRLVPLVANPVADWDVFDQMAVTPPRTVSSGLLSPVDTSGLSSRASDDSRAPKEAEEDNGSLGSLGTYHDNDEDTPAKTQRYPSPGPPVDETPMELDTPEKLLHAALFERISGVQRPIHPCSAPEERLLRGYSHGPSPEVNIPIKDTIPWKPIVDLHNTSSMQDAPLNLGTHFRAQNQSDLCVSPDMSRPIGASSSRYPVPEEEVIDGTIPDPMTPPGCGQDTQRSRSPLPRNRIPRSPRSPREEGVQLVEVRTRNTTELLEMHNSQPLQMVKLLMAYPDAMQKTTLSYKHIVVASHSRVEGLDDPAWLALEYQTSNSVGCHCHWVLDRSKLLKLRGTISTAGAGWFMAPSVKIKPCPSYGARR